MKRLTTASKSCLLTFPDISIKKRFCNTFWVDILFDVIQIFRNAELLVEIFDIDGGELVADPRLHRVDVVGPPEQQSPEMKLKNLFLFSITRLMLSP